MKRLAIGVAIASVLSIGSIGRGEEAPTAPDQLFDSLDADHDGILISDEIPEDKERYFEQLLRIGDDDSDGRLTKSEFSSALNEGAAPDKEPTRRPARDGNKAQSGVPQMFDRLDRDGDGKISRKDIPDGMPKPRKEALNAMFDRVGKDELTREDFKRARLPDSMENKGGGLSLDRLRGWDANQDGKLARDEVPEQARERFNRIFDRLRVEELPLDQLIQLQRRRGAREAGREGPPVKNEAGNSRPESTPHPEAEKQSTSSPNADPRPRPPFARGPEGRERDLPPGGLAMLRNLDTDHNGRLSREELANAIQKFDELDSDHDGQLDAPEILGTRGGFGLPGRGFGPERFGDRGPSMRDGNRREFGDRDRPFRPERDFARNGDSDRDRPSSDERMDPRMDHREGPVPFDARPDRRGDRGFGDRRDSFEPLLRFDVDHNGSVSRDEAPHAMREHFERLDRDGNGSVTVVEFHEAVAEEYGLHERIDDLPDRRPPRAQD